MCCEDLKIDFRKSSTVNFMVLPNTNVELAAPDPHRWSISFSAPKQGVAYIYPGVPSAAQQGHPLELGMLMQTFSRDIHGDLVGKLWMGSHSTGGVGIFILETFFYPQSPCQDVYND